MHGHAEEKASFLQDHSCWMRKRVLKLLLQQEQWVHAEHSKCFTMCGSNPEFGFSRGAPSWIYGMCNWSRSRSAAPICTFLGKENHFLFSLIQSFMPLTGAWQTEIHQVHVHYCTSISRKVEHFWEGTY